MLIFSVISFESFIFNFRNSFFAHQIGFSDQKLSLSVVVVAVVVVVNISDF